MFSAFRKREKEIVENLLPYVGQGPCKCRRRRISVSLACSANRCGRWYKASKWDNRALDALRTENKQEDARTQSAT
jgi:hypothetical protein